MLSFEIILKSLHHLKVMLDGFNISVHIAVQTTKSLSYDYIQTDCVVKMDDDWDMPHEHLAYVMELWKQQFFDHLVEFAHQGRSHTIKNNTYWQERRTGVNGI